MTTSGEPELNCYKRDHIGNSAMYHTGKKCAVRGCDKPAGTLWGKDNCFDHNVIRLKAIDGIYSKADQADIERGAAQ